MNNIKFCDLHSHSQFSLQDAHPSPLEMVIRAKEIGRDSLGLTDHASISGWVQFDKACKENGISPKFGIESYIVTDLEEMYTNKIREKSHITILAKNLTGYKNILKLASLAYSEGFYYRPTIDTKTLFGHSDGLIVLSGCWTGFVQKALKENNLEEAQRLAQQYKSVFGDRYYLETQHFPLFKDTINGLEYVSSQLDIPIVLTCDPHYLKAEHAPLQEILHAIRDKRNFDQNQIIYGAYQWPSNELFEAVKTISPQSPWEKYFEDTYNISQRIEDIVIPKGGSPKYQCDNSYELLKSWALEGFNKLGLKYEGEYKQRFDYELDIISNLGFCDYILVIADMIRWAKEQNICCGPGRGSSAGSLICYLVGITLIDPLKHDLIMERFLAPIKRDTPPDIDCDFDMDRRDEVKNYMANKYGHDFVCNIGTFGFFKGRSSLDDIRRVFSLPQEEINSIKIELPQYNESDERGNHTVGELFKNSDNAKLLLNKYPDLKNAEYLDGHIRQIGEHASGLVVSNVPLRDIVAVYERQKDDKIHQFSCFDMLDAESLGLLKIDTLGITELTIISDICKKIGMSFEDLYKISIDDKETLRGFAQIDVEGIFQFSGYATKNVLKQFRNLNSFNQLVAIVALSRPGPVNSGLTKEYINGANGYKNNGWDWNPILKEITKDTYFVPVYQEEIMFVCNKLGGMNWTDTDKIRKLMGKKFGDEAFEPWFNMFRDGCAKNGVDERQARKLWDDIKEYGSYSFNKCITGDSIIENLQPNKNSKKQYTVKELFENNGYTSNRWREQSGYKKMNVASLCDDGKLRPNRIKKIWYSGKQDVYRIITDTNKEIKATANHRFMGKLDWTFVSDFKVDDFILVSDGYRQKDFTSGVGSGWRKGRKGGAGDFIDFRTKEMSDFKKSMKGQPCEICYKTNVRLEAHHVTRKPPESTFMWLCSSCHKKEEYKNGRAKRWDKGHFVRYDKVVSIEYIGKEDTYDIEMEDSERPSFVVNGFVSHNSHSVCYALVAFWGMYLKRHFPMEYFWARLSREDNEDKVKLIAQDAKRHGLKLLKPRLGKSLELWNIEDTKTLRAGLTYIKGIGPKAAESLVSGGYLTKLDCETKKSRAINKKIIRLLEENDAFTKEEV